MAKRLNIEATLQRILEYAAHSEDNRPLLIRTDSLLTSDILRYASAMLIENSRLVVPGITSATDDGLNILSMYDTSDPAKVATQIECIKDRPFIFIVNHDYEENPGDKEIFSFINCFNDEVMPTIELARKLEKLPPELYIFACVDSHHKGLIPMQMNKNAFGYGCLVKETPGKLVRISQLLDVINQVKYLGRSIVSPDSFPVGIDVKGRYTTGDDYITIDMMSRNKYVDRLFDKLKPNDA